jgi:ABC-type transport system substrate-binding protein
MLLMVSTAWAATRPRYGGTLRVEMRAQVRSLDPADDAASAIVPLLFDSLVTMDSAARPQPSLAVSWTAESDRRWRFTIRHGVTFSDGTVVTSAAIAASLHNANPDWNVRDVGDIVIIETDSPSPNLVAQLAMASNAIVLRDAGKMLGTGPFVAADFQPAVRATLRARDDGWHSRAFIDRLEIQFNRGLREQGIDLETGRADEVEVSPEEGARAGSTRRLVRSDPSVLYALRFSHTNPSTRDARIRETVSLSIDRDAIANILLQRRGEPAAGLLPNWVSGYSFLFPTQPRLARARQLRSEARNALPMALVYRAADPLARLIAERIALNAADAGLSIRPTPDSQNIVVPDIELVSLRLPSSDPATSLGAMCRPAALALPCIPLQADSPEDVYHATAAALKDGWAVPIVFVPVTYGLGLRVSNWMMDRTGGWQLENVSLQPERNEVRP